MDKKKEIEAFLNNITLKSIKTQLTERTPFYTQNLTRALSAIVLNSLPLKNEFLLIFQTLRYIFPSFILLNKFDMHMVLHVKLWQIRFGIFGL